MEEEKESKTLAAPKIDKFINKSISRKLLVFIMGTIFFVTGVGITPDDWMTLAVAYVGTQGFIDAILAYKGQKQ